ncbi:MAG: hypothetical protein ACYDBS_01700 [Acidimicrobiales bacterium]
MIAIFVLVGGFVLLPVGVQASQAMSTSVGGGGQTPTSAFVIGNLNSTAGASVEFWGAQWSQANPMSGGKAPASFKGYADTVTPGSSCTGAWTTSTGNSSVPPSTVPGQIEVIVASHVTQSGSTISGNVVHVVLVDTNPGYDGNPGHAGTGTVVSVIC